MNRTRDRGANQVERTGRDSPRRRRRWLFRAIALMVGLLAGGLAVEFVLRFYDPAWIRGMRLLIAVKDGETNRDYFCYSSNPAGELGGRPNTHDGWEWKLFDYGDPLQPLPLSRLEETPYCVTLPTQIVHPSILEDPEARSKISFPPVAAGKLRILGIGDSFAAGQGVPPKKRLFARLDRLVGERYEVLNGAYIGFDTIAERKVLEVVGPASGATRAIIVWLANDMMLTPELEAEQSHVNDLFNFRRLWLSRYRSAEFFKGNLRLFALVASWLEMREVESRTLAWYRHMYDPHVNRGGLQRFAAELQAMNRIPGIRSVFVMYPLILGFDEKKYPLQGVHWRVAKIARTAGLPVLDLTPAFMGKDPAKLRVHPADHHPNGRAHAIAARAIAQWLERDVPWFLDASAAGANAR